MAATPGVELVIQVLQLRRQEVPVVQHVLQAVGDAGRIMGRAQVARDDNQLSVTGTVFVGGKFHGGESPRSASHFNRIRQT
ncbi:hypothetical protein SDC9_201613 [bioreactor metagenome]|uniref:Uncharacterized protein n=1 Tax=bioreactor metagenome TaxID=1076179 RepID=A0A645J0B6_9ZZZZ